MNPSDVVEPAVREKIAAIAGSIRKRVMKYTISNNGGYLSQACSSAEILASLYVKIMNLGKSEAPAVPPPFPGVPGKNNRDYFTGGGYNGPKTPDLDRFYLSPAHYALVLYTVLIETGRMNPNGLDQFNQDGTSVEMIGAEHSPGFEMMGGSLAQTLSQSAGIALARKLRNETGRVWVFLSDGEFQEGQTWEAIQTMSFYGIDNIGIYIDINGQQCDGEVCDVMSLEPLSARIQSFGGRVITVDGHDIDALIQPAKLKPNGRPLFILCYTDPCKGIPLLTKRRPKLHYVRFSSPEEREEYRRYYETNMQNPGEGK